MPLIKLSHDFETQSPANLKKVGAYEYSMHPETRVMCLAFKLSGGANVWLFDFHQMQKQYSAFAENFRKQWEHWISSPDFIFSAHNSFFETCIYNNVLVRRFGWPAIPITKRRCTAAKAAAVAIPRNLADAGAVMKTAVQKDFEGHRIMMKLCKPTSAWVKWEKQLQKYIARGQDDVVDQYRDEEPTKYWTPENAPDDFKKLYQYCKIDVIAEEKLDEALPDLTRKEQELWVLDQKINLRGIQVDMPLVNKIVSIMEAEAKTMNKELDVLTMGLVSSGNARAAILDFLTLEGLELPNLRAKTVDDFLTNGKATGDAEIVLKLRRALSKSSTAKYHTFQRRAASDGRVRDILLYHGASTGRWGGVGIQPQNFPRGIIKDIFEAIDRIKTCTVDELKMLYGENLMPLFSSVLRGMFISSDGFDLFVEDYSAIECRVSFWLAGHHEGLQMFRDGRDPYREMAVDIYKKDLLLITDDERQVGKAAVLGCGFQMGGKKFVTSAWDVYRAKVDLAMAKVAVTAYRERHWPVAEVWDNYNNACISAVENPGSVFKVGRVSFFVNGRFLWIQLPSGRRLAYCDPHVVWATTAVMQKGDDIIYASNPSMFKDALLNGYVKVKDFKSQRFVYWAINHKAKKVDCTIPKWTRESSYGGKIFENVVQGVARDLLAEAIVRANKKGFGVLMHSHDEAVSEAKRGQFTADDYKAVMEQLPDWADGLPLKAGGWTGTRYKKG